MKKLAIVVFFVIAFPVISFSADITNTTDLVNDISVASATTTAYTYPGYATHRENCEICGKPIVSYSEYSSYIDSGFYAIQSGTPRNTVLHFYNPVGDLKICDRCKRLYQPEIDKALADMVSRWKALPENVARRKEFREKKMADDVEEIKRQIDKLSDKLRRITKEEND